jgi:transcriptional regulator with GAF, ATPase, and Fis domain
MRDDFFYRLCSNQVEVPPLRARIAQAPAELGQLVGHLCARITGSDDRELSAELTRTIERDLGPGYDFPGNVREIEQCVRRVLLTGACARDERYSDAQRAPSLSEVLGANPMTAEQLLEQYCAALYQRHPSFVEVARITGLDRRTVKKHVTTHHARQAHL